MKTMVVDLGSSYVKSAILDMESGRVLEEEKRQSPARKIYEDKLLFEVPAVEYVEIVKDLLERWSKRYRDLDSLLLSTQMHGFIYEVPGEEDPVYISWQDMRCLHLRPGGGTYLEWLQSQLSRQDMEDCGVYLKPSLGLCNLHTFLEENPSIVRGGTLYTLGSYVIRKLTGHNICHISNAAPWGLVDVKHGRWSGELLKRMGFEDIKLPTLAETDFQSCGSILMNGCRIQVYPDYGDQQIAVLGSMPEEGEGLINIATASQVSRISEDFCCGAYEIRPFFEGRFLNTISNMPSGRGLDVLVRFLTESVELLTGRKLEIGEFWECVEKQFDYNPQGLLADMSFYATPSKLDGGEIRGITQNNLSVNSLFSAAFCDMAKTYRSNLEVLFGGHPMKQLVCSGGVSWKRPELVEIISHITGCPCRLSVSDDEALEGLYRAALCCSGLCKDLNTAGEWTATFRR